MHLQGRAQRPATPTPKQFSPTPSPFFPAAAEATHLVQGSTGLHRAPATKSIARFVVEEPAASPFCGAPTKTTRLHRLKKCERLERELLKRPGCTVRPP